MTAKKNSTFYFASGSRLTFHVVFSRGVAKRTRFRFVRAFSNVNLSENKCELKTIIIR